MSTAREERLRRDTNRLRFRQLLDEHDIKQHEAANLIKAGNAPCSERTVRAWLASVDAKTALPCPDWALASLERAIRLIQRYNAKREAEEQAKTAATQES